MGSDPEPAEDVNTAYSLCRLVNLQGYKTPIDTADPNRERLTNADVNMRDAQKC